MSTVRLDSPKCGIGWSHTGENEGDDKVDMAGQVGHELHKGDPIHPDQVGIILANHSLVFSSVFLIWAADFIH